MRVRYFLSGFARCAKCGGSMQAVKWRDGARASRYVCATYWNNGRTVCDNDRALSMAGADRGIRELFAEEVLQPTIVEAALDIAARMLGDTSTDPVPARRAAPEQRLATLERQLANLAETMADGGAVPAVLDLVKAREAERQTVRGDLERLRGAVTATRHGPGRHEAGTPRPPR